MTKATAQADESAVVTLDESAVKTLATAEKVLRDFSTRFYPEEGIYRTFFFNHAHPDLFKEAIESQDIDEFAEKVKEAAMLLNEATSEKE